MAEKTGEIKLEDLTLINAILQNLHCLPASPSKTLIYRLNESISMPITVLIDLSITESIIRQSPRIQYYSQLAGQPSQANLVAWLPL